MYVCMYVYALSVAVAWLVELSNQVYSLQSFSFTEVMTKPTSILLVVMKAEHQLVLHGQMAPPPSFKTSFKGTARPCQFP